MNTVLFQNKKYVPIKSAVRMLNCKIGMMYYYINNNKVKTVEIDNIKLVELDSLLVLSDYIQLRTQKIILKK